MSYKAMKDSLIVKEIESKTMGGIILTLSSNKGATLHEVVSSGVDYIKDGDRIVCNAPSKLFKVDEGDSMGGVIKAHSALLVESDGEYLPMRDDILIQHLNTHATTGGLIELKDDPDANQLQIFEVIKTGSECKDVEVGMKVVVPWLRITPPFELDGYEKYTLTSEKEVVAILED